MRTTTPAEAMAMIVNTSIASAFAGMATVSARAITSTTATSRNADPEGLMRGLYPRPGQNTAIGLSGGSSFNHLIRPNQQRLGDRQPEGLGGLEVEHQLELGGLLDGEVAGLRALEDLVDVASGAAEQVGHAGPVGHKPPGVHSLSRCVAGREPVLGRQCWDLRSHSRKRQGVGDDNERLGALPRDSGERAFNLPRLPDLH